jgi:putative addiction module killer protein
MMIEIKMTRQFEKWFHGFRDARTKARIAERLRVLQLDGHFGDVKSLGQDLHEMRFFFGAGYRIYYAHEDDCVVLLLGGGDKNTQVKDIAAAYALLKANTETL